MYLQQCLQAENCVNNELLLWIFKSAQIKRLSSNFKFETAQV